MQSLYYALYQSITWYKFNLCNLFLIISIIIFGEKAVLYLSVSLLSFMYLKYKIDTV